MHERTSVRRADVAVVVVVVVGGSRRLRRERDEHGNRILDTLVRGILRCSFPFLGAGGDMVQNWVEGCVCSVLVLCCATECVGWLVFGAIIFIYILVTWCEL